MKKRTPKGPEVKPVEEMSPERQARWDDLARRLAERNRELDEEERLAKAGKRRKKKEQTPQEARFDELARILAERSRAIRAQEEQKRAALQVPSNVIRFPQERARKSDVSHLTATEQIVLARLEAKHRDKWPRPPAA